MADGVNLKTFSLPRKYLPGTDLMSKLLLVDQDLINIVVSAVIGMILNMPVSMLLILFVCVGPNAKDQYVAIPTEWIDFTRSDVAYEPVNSSNDLPLILIEIQNKADTYEFLSTTNRLLAFGF